MILFDKKGSHVGIILSFVIFITFLIFIFTILEPNFKIKGAKTSTLETLEASIIDNLTINVEVIDVQFEVNPANCAQIQNTGSWLPKKHLSVKDSTGYRSFHKNNSALEILYVNGPGTFFKIYAHDDIESFELPSSCVNIVDPTMYNVSLIKSIEYISERRIAVLANSYNTNYDSLKTQLKIPKDSDFGFTFTFWNGTDIRSGENESSTQIFSSTESVVVMDSLGNITIGKLNTRIF